MPLDPRRENLVGLVQRDVGHQTNITYGEVRPTKVKQYQEERWPVTTDCSGWYQCLCYTAKLPDPMGTGYAGADTVGCQGNTDTLLSHLADVPLSRVLPGDCVVYGRAPSVHVAVFTTSGAVATPRVGSNGNPDAPDSMTLAEMTAGFPGRPVTYLALPVPNVVPVRQWKVRSLNGKLLAETKHPVRWAVAHPRSFRRHVAITFHQEET